MAMPCVSSGDTITLEALGNGETVLEPQSLRMLPHAAPVDDKTRHPLYEYCLHGIEITKISTYKRKTRSLLSHYTSGIISKDTKTCGFSNRHRVRFTPLAFMYIRTMKSQRAGRCAENTGGKHRAYGWQRPR